MSIIKMILGGISALVAVALSGFVAGNIRGSGKAKARARARANQQRTEENAAATVAAAERKVEVTKEASNVQQKVNHMPDDDVDSELRAEWTRKG
ncbi:hypothetical protein KKZ58_07940 [Enterobacter kobei]|uniref:hypothetical protein n=1 Tax=Enterobacter kobei TaxID=208224 RepID=UPI001BDFF102|nr:hypothetical protein [Enterobacter kobei]MBT1947829.1 hypothetical protein [Enterobacter kobei]